MIESFESGTKYTIGPKRVTFGNMVQFERVIWDRGSNAHSDPEAAKRDGLDAPIASGQHQMAFLHELFETAFGDRWAESGFIDVRYVYAVRGGDALTMGLEIKKAQRRPDGQLAIECDVECRNQEGIQTARGYASVVTSDGTQEAIPGPLSGLRVLELTHAWAGPYSGMMMADMGADVIKIESPRQTPEARGGYPYVEGESVPFLMLHRGKRSMTLDLKTVEGRAEFLRIVADTDVLIQNFRPGALDKLDLTYEALSIVNPRLIYASISGYGKGGDKSHLPGVNMIAQAESGLAATTMRGGLAPAPLGTALCDIVAAMWATHGVLCAVIERESSGRGQFVDASLVDAGLSLMHSPVAMHYFGDTSKGDNRFDGNAPSAFLEALDGRYVALFASYPALWDRFIASPHFTRLADEPRFYTREKRNQHAAELHADIAAVVARETAPYWVEHFNELDIPAAIVNTIGEALADETTRKRGMVQMTHHPTAGTVPVLGVPVRLSRTPGRAGDAAPLLGQHNRSGEGTHESDTGWPQA